MHVHLAGRRLKDQMGADRRRVGGGLEFDNRAKKKTFAAQVITAKLLRIRLTCLLRVRGNAKRQCEPKCECANLTSYKSFHIPFPAARVPLGTFRRCGPETKKTASRRKPKVHELRWRIPDWRFLRACAIFPA